MNASESLDSFVSLSDTESSSIPGILLPLSKQTTDTFITKLLSKQPPTSATGKQLLNFKIKKRDKIFHPFPEKN